jgi:hypothetical protein
VNSRTLYYITQSDHSASSDSYLLFILFQYTLLAGFPAAPPFSNSECLWPTAVAFLETWNSHCCMKVSHSPALFFEFLFSFSCEIITHAMPAFIRYTCSISAANALSARNGFIATNSLFREPRVSSFGIIEDSPSLIIHFTSRVCLMTLCCLLELDAEELSVQVRDHRLDVVHAHVDLLPSQD